MEPRELTQCRVTVNMVGARLGDTVLVDLTSPGMQTLVEGGMLVPQGSLLGTPPASTVIEPVALAEQSAEAPEASQEPPGADAAPDAAPSTPGP